jgi:hypothetical protein
MNTRFIKTAERISLMTPKRGDQEVIYNFLFGALHALAQAEKLNYSEASIETGKSKRRTQEVRQLATEMAKKNSLRTQGKWLAGYFFNDAIFRLGICVEHIIRYSAGKHRKKNTLHKAIRLAKENGYDIKTRIPKWNDSVKEVDALRHNSWDYMKGPNLSYLEALQLMDNLVELAEEMFNASE